MVDPVEYLSCLDEPPPFDVVVVLSFTTTNSSEDLATIMPNFLVGVDGAEGLFSIFCLADSEWPPPPPPGLGLKSTAKLSIALSAKFGIVTLSCHSNSKRCRCKLLELHVYDLLSRLPIKVQKVLSNLGCSFALLLQHLASQTDLDPNSRKRTGKSE